MPIDTCIPKGLLPIERAQVIFDMLDAGCPMQEIYAEHLVLMRTTYPTARPATARRVVDKVLLNKQRYCPDIDEVAVERAYDGDRNAWVALTYYERQTVVDRLYETWVNRPFHRHWPGYDSSHAINEWAKSVGENPDRITHLRRGPGGSRRRA